MPARETATMTPAPADDGRIRFLCRACHQRMKVRAELAGRAVGCPRCGVSNPVPLGGDATVPNRPPSGASHPG